MGEPAASDMLPHASQRVPHWTQRWRESGRLVLLLDFDGTLAPIVDRPELAAIPPETRAAVERLAHCPGVSLAVVSGRGLIDARERVALPDIAYAGNHGMEIEGPGIHRMHADAVAARPLLDAVAAETERALDGVRGAFVEHKQMTLSVHHRLVPREEVAQVREAVERAAARHPTLHVTEGKEVLEVRPRVDWHKGRAVEFLLESFHPPPGAPVLYFGDDRTDEDAFVALRAWRGGDGEGVVVAESPPAETAATAFARDPREVGEVLAELARGCSPTR